MADNSNRLNIDFKGSSVERSFSYYELEPGRFYYSKSTAPNSTNSISYEREKDVIFVKNHRNEFLFFNKATGDYGKSSVTYQREPFFELPADTVITLKQK